MFAGDLCLTRFIPVHTGNMQHFFGYHATTSGLSLCIQGTCQKRDGVYWTPSVYPCAYREHADTMSIPSVLCGLSLCIQGTYLYTDWKKQPVRFIPVHTGNIITIFECLPTSTVYPCAYREHEFIFF